jgi:hypothetical protein
MPRADRTLTIGVIRSNPPKWGYCRACRARIEWVTTLKGRAMPVTSPLSAVDVSEREDGTAISHIPLEQSHFATCPAANDFRKQKVKRA